MADGDVILRNDFESPVLHVKLTDAATGTGNGVWVDIRAFRKEVSLHVDGINGDTIVVSGSSAASIPANSAHGDQIGSNVTADGFYAVPNPPAFIKARCSVYSAGTISVYLVASK